MAASRHHNPTRVDADIARFGRTSRASRRPRRPPRSWLSWWRTCWPIRRFVGTPPTRRDFPRSGAMVRVQWSGEQPHGCDRDPGTGRAGGDGPPEQAEPGGGDPVRTAPISVRRTARPAANASGVTWPPCSAARLMPSAIVSVVGAFDAGVGQLPGNGEGIETSSRSDDLPRGRPGPSQTDPVNIQAARGTPPPETPIVPQCTTTGILPEWSRRGASRQSPWRSLP